MNPHEFIRTYSPPTYEDPVDAVEDYERVKEYTAAHPQKKSHAVSNSIDLPRERIRSWVDGDGMPDCYRGLQTALSNDWIVEEWNNETAEALNCLAAWILSSGSINDRWEPTFTTDENDEEIAALRSYATAAGVRIKRTREPDDDRPPEWKPTKDAAVLGRVLYTLSQVKGDKSREDVDFPEYLNEAPDHIVQAFAQVYVQQRGTVREDRNNEIQIIADRHDGFRRALKRTLQRVVDDPDDIRGEAWPLRVRGEAIETLRQYP